MAGWLRPPAEAVHVSFGSVLGADSKMLRSRSGDAVKLIELLDEAVERAARRGRREEPRPRRATRGPTSPGMIGIGAVKYADLSTDRVQRLHLRLGPDALVRRQHRARTCSTPTPGICSIFRRAGIDRDDRARAARSSIVEPQERAARPAVARVPDRDRRDDRRRTRRTSCATTCSTSPRTSPRSTSTARS